VRYSQRSISVRKVGFVAAFAPTPPARMSLPIAASSMLKERNTHFTNVLLS
jgi:hypothetical protein